MQYIDEERTDLFIETFSRGFSKDLEALYEKCMMEDIPVIRRDMMRFLRFLLLKEKPKKILEIGTGIGFSAIFMESCLGEDTEIITFENSEKRYNEALLNIKERGLLGRITIVFADALFKLKENKDYTKDSFDLIFLDGAKGQYKSFYEILKPLLKRGGILLTDNIFKSGDVIGSKFSVQRRDRTIHKRMREFLSCIKEDDDIFYDILPIGDGILLCVKK